jgi:SAM-dependent methyltransferase
MKKSMYDSDVFFTTYLEQTAEKRVFVEHLRKRLEHDKPGSILDLGCHDGAVTLEYLKAVDQSSDDQASEGVGVTCVDPSASAIEAFRERNLPANADFTFCVSTAEDFLDSNDKHFDWTVASHSLYWSRELTGVIGDIVAASDKAAIVLRRETGLFQVQTHFKNIVGSRDEQFYNANDVEKSLHEIGAKFQREDIESEVAIPERGASAFASLVAFFLQTDAEVLTENQLDDIHAFLAEKGNPFPHHVSFFWIG